jgi:hypothetical protein
MRNKIILECLFSIVLINTIASCTYNKPIVPVASCNNSGKTVSFSNDIQPIFTNNCNNVGCHSGNSPAGNLNLEVGKAYAQLSKTGRGYIDVTEPNNSVLLSAMLDTTNPMPPSGKLDDCTIDLIRTWMKQGGLNN